MICPKCGGALADGAKFCNFCGSAVQPPVQAQQPPYQQQPYQQQPYQQQPYQQQPYQQPYGQPYPNYGANPYVSPKSRLCATLLCFFLGGLGVHRFYVGKIGTGILWLLTAGCLGIGSLVDLIMIACGNFRDKEGLPILNWDA